MTDDEIRIPRVKHIPVHPPRNSTPGEGIYLGLWREWAEANPEQWAAVFHNMDAPLRQRAASVAASFMVFMGCNCGRSFTEKAERLSSNSSFPFREGAFIAAWALENRRCHGLNSGLRTIEYMLAPEYPIDNGRLNRSKVPVITQDDHDVIECMVAWWSTGPAQVMRSIADPMIEAANRKQWSKMFETSRTGVPA